MPKMDIVVPHTLGREEALRRVKGSRSTIEGFEAANGKVVEEQWGDNPDCRLVIELMGGRVAMEVVVGDTEVTVHVELPLGLIFIQGIVRARMEEGLKQLLA